MTESQSSPDDVTQGRDHDVSHGHHGDVVDLLQDQHRAIRRLCDAVTGAPQAERAQPFRELLRLMAVHEVVEEEIVHPYVRRRVPEGAAMVSERLHEEHDGKRMLVALEALGPTSTSFPDLFARYRTALFTHIDREEASEFAGLRSSTRPAERTAMAAAVRVASALAPTHPHPGVESAMQNLLVGTPLAMIDRARDVIRQAMAARSGAPTAPAGPAPSDVPGEGASGPTTAGGPTAADTPAGGPTAADTPAADAPASGRTGPTGGPGPGIGPATGPATAPGLTGDPAGGTRPSGAPAPGADEATDPGSGPGPVAPGTTARDLPPR